ncbi:hypothetical protein MNBD_NITROSPINAE02-2075, partial [hydrothermal vent metagenome]
MVTPRTVDIGPLYKPDGTTALASATITFTLVDERGRNSAGYETSSGAQVAGMVSAITDANGLASASLVPNDQLLGTTYYNVSPADAYGYTRFRAYLTSGAGPVSLANLYSSSQDVAPANVGAFTLHAQSDTLHLTSSEDAALSSANSPSGANPVATIADIGGGGGGEVNTASNVGTGGVGLFKQKAGVNLEFKQINAGSAKVTITDDVANSEIDIDIIEASLSHDNLSGAGANTHAQVDNHLASAANPHAVTKADVGLTNVENLKVNLVAITAPGGNDDSTLGYAVGSRWIDVTGDKEYVCLDSSATAAVWTVTTGASGGGGETNTASNVGVAGVGVFKQKTGANLEFKKLNAGSTKVTVTDDAGNSEVDIDVVEANLAHDNLGGAGANTHTQIDTHISSANPHGGSAASGANSDITSLSGLTTALPVNQGGTGQTVKVSSMNALAPTTTKGDVIVHNGTDNIRVGVGADNQVLTADSTQASGVKWGAATGGSGGGLKSVQTFTVSGVWTKPAGINSVRVQLVGGGGGGAGSNGTSYNGAGGGAGGYSEEFIDVSAIASETVTVGTGGAGGAAGPNDGGA